MNTPNKSEIQTETPEEKEALDRIEDKQNAKALDPAIASTNKDEWTSADAYSGNIKPGSLYWVSREGESVVMCILNEFTSISDKCWQDIYGNNADFDGTKFIEVIKPEPPHST